MTIPRFPILGVQISLLNPQTALDQLHHWMNDRTHAYVCVTPAHSIMECVNDPTLLPVFNEASMVTPDGMAVVWLLRLRGFRQVNRVYGPDLLLSACAEGLQEGWRHFFFGGMPGVAQHLAENLQKRFQGLKVAGVYSPPMGRPTPEEEQASLNAINSSGADLLWIGMSSPWQEVWMHEHLGKVNIPIMAGVGAAFDYLGGTKPQAPRWMQKFGLEWLFRLANEPKRLWPRYRQYPRFLYLALGEFLNRPDGSI